jgi:SPP1 family phage portal protein
MPVNAKELDRLLKQLSNKIPKIEENNKYTMGRNPYILNKEQSKKPDNRMPVTLGKMAVDAMAGYAGKAGNIKVIYDLVSTETLDDDDPFIEYMYAMDDYNKTDIEISELYEEGIKQGVSYEIFWTSEKLDLPTGGLLTTEYKIVPNSEIMLKFSNDLKKELLYAVHFTKDDEEERATVYYPLYMDEWVRKTGGEGWHLEDTKEYPFTTVPVNIYKTNRFANSIFEAEKAFIDGIDEIISKAMNEVDRFNAAIALFGNIIGKQFADDFADGNISMIEGLSEDVENTFTPQYLEKDLTGVKDFYNQLMDRMEQWFRKSVGIADFSDDAFAGQQSGIAILFKLIPMEFRAAQIETYFNQGLNKRLEYYGDVYNASTASVDIDDYTTIVKSKRNIPVDTNSIILSAVELMKIGVSKETILEYLPEQIVPDAKKELERIMDEFEEVPFEIEGEDPAAGEEVTAQATEAVKLSGIQIKAANDIITLVGLPLDAGGITREAGINQLKIFLGLTDAQAALVMGNKQTGPAKSIKTVE